MTRTADEPFEATASPEQGSRRHDDGWDAIATSALAYAATMDATDLNVRLGASEDVLRARLALAEALMNAGWRPDGSVLASIHRDEALLQQSNGVLENGRPVSSGDRVRGIGRAASA
jgi:hypothetical protein